MKDWNKTVIKNIDINAIMQYSIEIRQKNPIPIQLVQDK